MSLITGTGLDNTLSGTSGDDTIQGLDGADSLNGQDGRDRVLGGAGNDTILGSAGRDSLVGGAGDDLLVGGADEDTFIFATGSGSDIVADLEAGDIIDLSEVLTVAGFDDVQARLSQQGTDAVVDLGNGDSIAIVGVDISTLTPDQVITEAANTDAITGTGANDSLAGDGFGNIISGLGGNDTLNGVGGADLLQGGDGNDLLNGGSLLGGFIDSSDDTLIGGAGNDTLIGRGGDDDFVFSFGFGQDVIEAESNDAPDRDRIVFDETFARSDIRITTSSDGTFTDLFAFSDADGSFIIIENFIVGGTVSGGVREIAFADGTTIDLDQGFDLTGDGDNNNIGAAGTDDTLRGMGGNDTLNGVGGADLLLGGDGNDLLNGGSLLGGFIDSSDDTLIGGAGNDRLIGRGGNDDFVFSFGFGQDVIEAESNDAPDRDRIVFDETFARSDIRITTSSDGTFTDLFAFSDADGSFIIIENFIVGGTVSGGVREIAFADGTTIDLDQGFDLTGDGDNNNIGAAGTDDTLRGMGGNDTLNGVGGADLLLGGDGNDLLNGGSLLGGFIDSSDDTLIGGAGNDTLIGRGGDDVFVFGPDTGGDIVDDFEPGDQIDLTALVGINFFAEVQLLISQASSDTVIDFGSGNSVTLRNVVANDLSANDFILAAPAPVQRIDPAVDAFIVGAGDQIVVTGVYSTADPVDETLTGIGIRVHFDSSVLQFDGLENLFQPALQPFGQVVEADSGDFDDDAATDSFVALNWADFGGQFPGVGTTPLGLFDILFTGLGSATDSNVNFSASSVALDRTFGSTSVDIATDRWPLPDTVTVAENSADGTLIADLAPIPIDPIDPGSFTLLDDASGRFVLDGFVLRVADGDGLDFEDDASHDISLRIANSAGGSVDRAITVNLTDVNEAPTAVAIDSDDIDEDAEAGDQVGTLSALDPEGGIIGFSLVDDAGGRFALDGNRLVVADGGLDFETAPGHSITVRATDTGGLSLDQVLDITVNDVAEATVDLDGDGQVNALTDGLIALGDLFGAPLSQLAGLAEPGSPGTDTLVLDELLDQARAEIFDVDGDGTTDALTDGLMILGHLFGAPQDQVAAFAQPGAIRTDPAEIAEFLDSFVPVEA